MGDDSFMIAGIDMWKQTEPNLHEPRLERLLKKDGFVLPPATEYGEDIPAVRFPSMAYCPVCNLLQRYDFFGRPSESRCPQCEAALIPSRFVIVCPKGHIDDFPYFEWVHSGGRPEPGVNHELYIRAVGVTASLRDILVSCSCGRQKTMEGAFGRFALRKVVVCKGRRPWLRDHDPETCDELPRTLQRGASNVYFPVTSSAISIPPWSEGAFKLLNKHWNVIKNLSDSTLAPFISDLGIATGTPYSVSDLVEAVKLRKSGSSKVAEDESAEALRRDEYRQLQLGREESGRDQEFVCVAAEPDEYALHWFDQVMLVKRLREVRVLEAFTRLTPLEGDDRDRLAPLSAINVDWLPAVEVIGEGVFLRLSSPRLKEWEQRPAVKQRVDRLNQSYASHCVRSGRPVDREITPRLVLIHTLAHALITQWTLESGYPTAALRERLYVDNEMAGLLIYTATSDAAGSLGGVVAQAMDGRLGSALKQAIQLMAWCSSDPLCIEADASGVDSLNLAACHACVLLPEVSCEEFNVLLDRALLVGTPEDPQIGFFADIAVE